MVVPLVQRVAVRAVSVEQAVGVDLGEAVAAAVQQGRGHRDQGPVRQQWPRPARPGPHEPGLGRQDGRRVPRVRGVQSEPGDRLGPRERGVAVLDEQRPGDHRDPAGVRALGGRRVEPCQPQPAAVGQRALERSHHPVQCPGWVVRRPAEPDERPIRQGYPLRDGQLARPDDLRVTDGRCAERTGRAEPERHRQPVSPRALTRGHQPGAQARELQLRRRQRIIGHRADPVHPGPDATLVEEGADCERQQARTRAPVRVGQAAEPIDEL